MEIAQNFAMEFMQTGSLILDSNVKNQKQMDVLTKVVKKNAKKQSFKKHLKANINNINKKNVKEDRNKKVITEFDNMKNMLENYNNIIINVPDLTRNYDKNDDIPDITHEDIDEILDDNINPNIDQKLDISDKFLNKINKNQKLPTNNNIINNFNIVQNQTKNNKNTVKNNFFSKDLDIENKNLKTKNNDVLIDELFVKNKRKIFAQTKNYSIIKTKIAQKPILKYNINLKTNTKNNIIAKKLKTIKQNIKDIRIKNLKNITDNQSTNNTFLISNNDKNKDFTLKNQELFDKNDFQVASQINFIESKELSYNNEKNVQNFTLNEKIIDQTNKSVINCVKNGINNFELQLEPKNLGTINLSINFKNKHDIIVSFKVENDEVLKILKAESIKIQETISNLGFNISDNSLHFDLNNNFNKNDKNQSFFEHMHQNNIQNISKNCLILNNQVFLKNNTINDMSINILV